MLLSCESTAGHDEDTLVGRLLPLCVIDTPDSGEGEGITQGTPCAVIPSFVVIVSLCGIETVWVGRVHPPGINTFVEKCLQILPIDFPGICAEGIIDLYSRGVVHAWRPDM